MEEFNKLPIDFKCIKTKTRKTQLKMERIIRNADGLYEKCYNAYKSNYDTDGELNEAKRKSLAKNSLNWLIKQIRSQN